MEFELIREERLLRYTEEGTIFEFDGDICIRVKTNYNQEYFIMEENTIMAWSVTGNVILFLDDMTKVYIVNEKILLG